MFSHVVAVVVGFVVAAVDVVFAAVAAVVLAALAVVYAAVVVAFAAALAVVYAAVVFVVAGRAWLCRVMQLLRAVPFAAGSRQRQSRQSLDSKHKTTSR